MGISQRISTIVKKQLASIQSAHDRRLVEAEARARSKLAKAKTTQARELAILQLQREKMALSKELSEAKLATQKAKTAAEKARKEAGDLTVGERLGVFGSKLGKEAKGAYKALEKAQRPKRKGNVRKVAGTATRRKTVTRKK